jgi:hypothetical protein
MTVQTRARYCLAMYGLAIVIMAVIAVAGSVSAKSNSPRIDVSAMMAEIDVGSLPVHNITDAF